MAGQDTDLKLAVREDCSSDGASTDEPRAKKARFGHVEFTASTTVAAEPLFMPAATTKRTTRTWVAVFEAYLQERGIAIDLKAVKAEDLASVLRQFYVEVRRQDGSTYQRNSLMGMRSALQRYLREPGVGRTDLNLISGQQFAEANRTLDAYLIHLEQEGHIRPQQHKGPLTREDLEKCLRYFYSKAESDPRVLTQAVWFLLTWHFSLRATEVEENPIRSYHLVFTTVEGEEVVTLSADYRTKSPHGGLVQDPDQVRLIRLLISKLHPAGAYVFAKARSRKTWTKEESVWYTPYKLGHNLIARFMPSISQELSLSQRYTCHCLRATASTALNLPAAPSTALVPRVSGGRVEEDRADYVDPSTGEAVVTVFIKLEPP